jgi:cobalt/nickel transport system permease protein
MHIADGILPGPELLATGLLAVAGVAIGLRRMDYERIPRVGVLASVFFVASLIHVPIGPASAHLLLNGLLGFLLGWASFPALAAALLLQAVVFGYGGLTALGANILVMATPAVLCHYLFAGHLRSDMSPKRVFALGFAAGAFGVVFSCVMIGLTLLACGREFIGPVGALVVGHVPVLVIEGFVTGSAVSFLYKVRPEFLASPLAESK